MNCRGMCAPIALTVTALAIAVPIRAEDGRFDLGVRGNIVGGSGKPSNDILGIGVFGRYWFGERWSVAFALDHSPGFDVERTASLVGLEQDPNVSDIDSEATSTGLEGLIERNYLRSGGRWEWFWSAGLGVNFVDVDDIVGPRADGGTFDVATDASTEFLVVLSVGARRFFGDRWGLEVALRGDQHFANWEYEDRISGAAGSTGEYLVRGVHFGILRRF